MLLDNPTLRGILDGRITVVFRTWRRPTVKAGGTLRTRMGVLAIDAVDEVSPAKVSARDIQCAGLADRDEFLRCISGRDGALYRIRVRASDEVDPRVALREKLPSQSELAELRKRLARMDAASSDGSWTHEYLAAIAARPAQRAPELAELFGLETKPFKQRVRRLKELGLTESLPVGYKLSPRGRAYLEHSGMAPALEPKRRKSGR